MDQGIGTPNSFVAQPFLAVQPGHLQTAAQARVPVPQPIFGTRITKHGTRSTVAGGEAFC